MSKLYKLYALLFARPFFYKWNFLLLRFSLRGLGILNFYNDRVSGEKYFIEEILPKYVDKNPILIDVGGNIGRFSIMLIEKFPNSKLHIFEPHPLNFKKLIDCNLPENACINNMALGKKEGSFEIFDYFEGDGSEHASIYKEVIEDIHGKKSISHEIKMTTLDRYIHDRNIDKVDFLKVDVEGEELNVFRGSLESINKTLIKVIQFEFNEMNVWSKTFFIDFTNLLNNYNFYRMLPKGLLPLKKYKAVRHEIFAFQNIVAIRKDIDKEN